VPAFAGNPEPLRNGVKIATVEPLLSRLRTLASVAGLATIPLLGAGLAGCGGTMYSVPPEPAPTVIPNEAASPLTPGMDALTALNQRPMRPPILAPNAKCRPSLAVDNGQVAPNYGQGVGPVYLSGQDSWYSAGQAALLMVDSKYSGPLLVRGFELGGGGESTVTLTDMPSAEVVVDKERQHGVVVVPALRTAAGGLELQAAVPSSFWRAWIGELSTDAPGCFGLQVDGDLFTEFIVFPVHAGKPPPG
jgi:hypothetical protein